MEVNTRFIGIIGFGYVGRATAMLFGPDKVLHYDTQPHLCSHGVSTLADLVNQTRAIFICVPTPPIPRAGGGGACDTSIVELVIHQIREINPDHMIIVRSTVPVGFCRKMNVSFMPEFLTEKNWEADVRNCKTWLLGTDDDRIIDLVGAATTKPIFTASTDQMEMVKYTRNAFLATKVAFFNEMAMFCDKVGLDSSRVLSIAALDPRIGASHTAVPGPDGQFGFGGTCLPKDTAALAVQFADCGVESVILGAVLERNNRIDRPRAPNVPSRVD